MSSYTSTSSTSSLLSPPPKQKYVKTSIGGAGNFLPSSLSPDTSPSSSRRSSSTATIGAFHTGIGGFGNRASINEQGSVVKETEVRKERESWHVGIGGAGNRRKSSVLSVGEGERDVRSGADAMSEMVRGYFVR